MKFMSTKTYKAIKSKELSEPNNPRYVIVDIETNEILDDAQGYGYKSAQNAYAGYGYKNRDKSKDAKKMQEEREIRQWWKKHKKLKHDLEYLAFDIAKGGYGPDAELNVKFLKELMEERGIESEFPAEKLLKVWFNLI